MTLGNGDAGELAKRIPKALGWIRDQGFTPTRPRGTEQPQPPVARPPEPPSPPSLVAPPSAPSPDDEEVKVFPARALVFAGKTKSGDQFYWRVFGKPYEQYGVPIYNEVLEEALAAGLFIDEELDPRQEYNIVGLDAHCTLNETGNPKKVIRLSRRSA